MVMENRERREVGAVWKKKGRTEYLFILLNDNAYLAFPNRFKKKADKRPDYRIYERERVNDEDI